MIRFGIALFAALLIVSRAGAAIAPAVGETYVYRVINGYNNELRGRVTYRVEKVEADRVTISVTPDNPALGPAHTEEYTPDGNWLRHPLINHDRPVEYEFSPAYPAYVRPLDAGKSWSVRVAATNPATGKRNSVRVDGEVRGSEHVQVPAGAFDAVKLTRTTYAGDWESFRHETSITEAVWLASALWQPVRIESRSGYIDLGDCAHESHACQPMQGDWNVFELVGHAQGG